jgi:hypothetical protein
MLELVIGSAEFYDEEKELFVQRGGAVVQLEHSLVSLSKWESIWEVPFLSKESKTSEQIISYIECMNLTPDLPEGFFSRLSEDNYSEINAYIEKKSSATWFNDSPAGRRNSETITSELIYYWLVTFQIPFEVETWNLNRLFTLVKVCNAKNQKPKKQSRNEVVARNRELNEQRKRALQTNG